MVWPIIRKQSRNLRLRRPSSQRAGIFVSAQNARFKFAPGSRMLLSQLARCLGGEMMSNKVRFAVAFVAAACPPWRAFRPASLNSPRVPAILIFLLLLSFASSVKTASAQDTQPQSEPQSLGDIARQARAAKASAPKAATVLDDDNLPKSKGGAGGGLGGGGILSGDKQAFCDEVRQRKERTAEQVCAVLAIDMGSEYESLTARYVELAKSACAANGGHLPTGDPKDPSLAAQARELGQLSAKFSAMMEAELKAVKSSEAAFNALRMEKAREEYAQVPALDNKADLSNSDKQKFDQIEEKYKSREQKEEAAAAQQRARGLRYVYDMARLQELCDHH